MNSVSYLEHLDELPAFISAGVGEVILGHRELSRTGLLTSKAFHDLAWSAFDQNLKIVMEWDLLLTPEQLKKNLALIQELALILPPFSLRVLDMGAVEASLRLLTVPLQLCLESGHHNLVAIEELVKYCGPRLERLVLSLELPQTTLALYLQKFLVAGLSVELLAVGPLLIFYSPRPLLSAQAFSSLEESNAYFSEHWQLSAAGSSEESPHRGFPLVESRHGTLMYLPKHHSLIEELDRLKDLGLSHARLDLRGLKKEHALLWEKFLAAWGAHDFVLARDLYPYPCIRGFHGANKSDVLFGKLKNSRLRLGDPQNYFGQVVEVKRGQYLAVKLGPGAHGISLSEGRQARILHPEGGEVEAQLSQLKNIQGQDLTDLHDSHLVLMPYRKGVVVKSAIYLQ